MFCLMQRPVGEAAEYRIRFVPVVWLSFFVLVSSTTAYAEALVSTSTIDFGVVPRGLLMNREVLIQNRFSSPLEIGAIKTSCGCTAALVSQTSIPAGQRSVLRTQLDGDRFSGLVQQSVTIEVLKPVQRTIQLTVKADIREDLSLNPGSLDWKTFLVGDRTTRSVQLTYTGTLDFRVQSVSTPGPYVDVEYQERERQPGRVVYEIAARLTKQTTDSDLHSAVICTTDHPQVGTFTIAVSGSGKTTLLVEPDNLFMGFVKPGGEASKSVQLRALQPFKIKQIIQHGQIFQIAAAPEAQRQHELSVRFLGPAKPGYYSDRVRLLTTLPAAPEIQLRVFGWVDKK